MVCIWRKLTKIVGKGFELLALFNVEYDSNITDALMQNPNSRFKLELRKISRIKK